MPVHYLRLEGISPGEDVGLLRFDSTSANTATPGGASARHSKRSSPGKPTRRRSGRRRGTSSSRSGEVPPGRLAPFWTSPPFNHCNFTVLASLDAELADAWTAHLLAMDWGDPEHRRILELEGLREWVPPSSTAT